LPLSKFRQKKCRKNNDITDRKKGTGIAAHFKIAEQGDRK